jgi:hypothetical protein
MVVLVIKVIALCLIASAIFQIGYFYKKIKGKKW